MVRDLLGSGKSLALQEAGQQVMVPGLSLHKPSSAEELLQMLARGNRNRSQHATDANAESSRSHAVFQVTRSVWRGGGLGILLSSRIVNKALIK